MLKKSQVPRKIGPKSLARLVYLRFKFNMKKLSILFLFLAVFFSCKKEKKSSPATDPQPEQVQTGNVTINVITYDSLGNVESDFSGVKVSLYQTAFSGTTGPNGSITFNNVPYGEILPVLVKGGYEGLPTSFSHNSNVSNVSLPCAAFSAYRVPTLTGQLLGPDSINLSFSLTKPVPAGKVCRLAVLYSDTIDATPAYFQKADSVTINTQFVQKLNVAKLPNLSLALNQLPKNKFFYINVVPVSYGIVHSKVLGKQTLVGDNVYPPANLNLKKTW